MKTAFQKKNLFCRDVVCARNRFYNSRQNDRPVGLNSFFFLVVLGGCFLLVAVCLADQGGLEFTVGNRRIGGCAHRYCLFYVRLRTCERIFAVWISERICHVLFLKTVRVARHHLTFMPVSTRLDSRRTTYQLSLTEAIHLCWDLCTCCDVTYARFSIQTRRVMRCARS